MYHVRENFLEELTLFRELLLSLGYGADNFFEAYLPVLLQSELGFSQSRSLFPKLTVYRLWQITSESRYGETRYQDIYSPI